MFNAQFVESCTAKLLTQEALPISNLITGDQNKTYQKSLKNEAGCYCFWWYKNPELLSNALKDCEYYIKLSHKAYTRDEDHFQRIIFDSDWINAATRTIKIGDTTQKAICLYVGKSTNIRSRVQGHLRINSKDLWSKLENVETPYTSKRLQEVKYGFGKKPNTVSQVRIGLERIFKKQCIDKIFDYVCLSWMSLEDSQNTLVNRFYMEDKLIADLYPLLNLDGER